MTLRKKTAVLMGGTLLGLIGALAATFQVFYLDRFRKLQEQDALESATRAIGALAEETARQASLNQDYANWDELYSFMQTRDEHFAATGLPNSATQVTARVDLLALLDAAGSTVLGRAFDPKSGAATPLPGGVERLLSDGRLLASAEGKGVEGVLLVGELPLIVTTRPIRRSDLSGPPRGTLFMGSYLDSARIGELARYAHAALKVHRVDDVLAPENVGWARSRLSEQVRTLARPSGADLITSFGLVDDIFGKPTLVFEVESPRRILREGRASLAYLVAALVIVGLGFSGVALFLIEAFVLSRLGRLSAAVGSITASADFSGRVAIPGRDELSRLADDVNGMLDALEASRHSLEQSEAKQRQSQKLEAVGRLAGGIAHDFNNLLNVITGYAELLLRHVSTEQQRKRLQEILKASERAAALTRQLLTFSRKQVFQPRVLDVNAVVAEMEPLLRRLIGDHIELATALDPGLGRIKGDPAQIEHVIMNLAVNARDAMPRSGKLTITTANRAPASAEQAGLGGGPQVVLTVSDTGTGMDAETQARIFEPFFTTKDQGKGTGLGLATVYGIVQQSHGSIRVRSELGKGTTFEICFPQVAPAAEPAASQHPASSEPPEGSETVLLVEDQAMVRALACEMLAGDGYQVLEAAGPSEAQALSKAYSGRIHVLVTDVVMPKLSGPELAARLVAQRPDMQVIYLSGYTADSLGEHGILGEDVHLLQKPFPPAALTRKLRELLDKAAPGAAVPR